MKKGFGVLVGIVVMVVGVVIGCMPAFARTKDEAEDACQKTANGETWVESGNTLKCYMIDAESSKCSAAGGTFSGRGDKGDFYLCLIPFEVTTKVTTTTSEDDDETEYEKKKKECDSKGLDTVASTGSGTGAHWRCETKTEAKNTKLPEKKQSGGGDANDSITNKHDNTVETNFFGNVDVGSDGDGVFMVLNVILQVLTWGVGIAGTAGIIFTGIQYMTAKDDVAQLTKAKNRLIQIVIGLAAYAVMWAFLQWLLPGGIFGN